MYYSSGNYEAFARPKKPAGVDGKSAYIIGTGLAALSAACYLVRDGRMPGGHIHIFEKDPVAGGACDGANIPGLGYVMRGGREMDNHFEVMWDLFRSIPSIETEGVSVLDEYYWLNKEDPNYSLCRATKDLGKDAGLAGKFGLSDKASMEIMKLFFTPDEELYDKPITDFFDDEVLNSNFWLYWRTMFAFENWHSALEMKLYIKRYIHHIGGLPDFSALRFTRYNQYDPLQPVRVDDPADGEVSRIARRAVPLQHQGRQRRVRDRRRERAQARTHRRRAGHDPEDPGRVGLLQAQPVRFADQEDRGASRHRPRGRQVVDRPDRERSGVHHQRRLRGELDDGLAEGPGRVESGSETGRRLGHVAQHRQAGSELRPSGQVLLRPERHQVDERHRDHARRRDPAVYQAHLQA